MRAFLDSSVAVSIIIGRNEAVDEMWLRSDVEYYINDYVVKEVRRVLKYDFKFSEFRVELALERLGRGLAILPTPTKNEYRKVRITDKSDRPIVCSAMKHGCVLVTEDRLLRKEAGRYVRTLSPGEALRLVG